MKKKSTSQSAFFNLRVLIGALFCLGALAVALFGAGVFAQPKGTQRSSRSKGTQDAPGTQRPDVVQMVGPVRTGTALRNLRYIPQEQETEEGEPLTRYPRKLPGAKPPAPSSPGLQSLLKGIFRPTPTMPGPLLTFDGVSFASGGCNCAPPDTDGDVGPNHYVQAVNSSFQVFDKDGNSLAGPTTYNTLFAPLGAGTPCGASQNRGDPFAFYDHVADRWIISDFAFPGGLPGSGPFFQCIAVSETGDPTGSYVLYSLQHEPSQATWVGDYPKMAMWNNPLPDGAYYLSVNLFNGPTLAFQGVRVTALDRGSMIAGGPANAIGFTVLPAGVGDSYSLVPANFRTGNPPPSGRDEFFISVDSPGNEGVTLTQVHGWFFHADFVTPGNSTFGVGANHTPNAQITVNGFVDAFTLANGFAMVPQQGTSTVLDTLGDKIMTPMWYRFDGANESLWAAQTVVLNFPNGPTAVRWYQFDVSGGTFPATPAQQQDWTNGNDGLWRFMPSIAVDDAGNAAIGYSVSSGSVHPGIRYAGRLSADPPNDLTQGEATLFTGAGSQTGGLTRWGDYSYTAVDPADGMTFWHTNEYIATNGSFNWSTRVGKFDFVGGGASPTPSPSPTPASCSWSAGQDLPGVGARFAGVFFPPNGKFYAMGGRDVNDVEFPNPFEYDPVSNTWTTKSATYPDGTTNNMACSVLNDSGTDFIYCVGGSQFGTNAVTGRVFRYDPIADVITTVAGGDWPPGVDTLPGGWSVFNNKLYILGGFNMPPTGDSTDQIWEFTPTANTWVQKGATLPVALGYIPTTTIGNLIYTGGGAIITAGALTDDADSFVYDPGADSISPIASIPRPTSNTRGLNFNGQMYVLGGSFNAISNEVDIYDPVSDSWSLGPPFTNARRSFAAGTDGTANIWLAGGYDVDGATKLSSTEIFNCPQVSPTATPTATATATATAAPSATPSVTPSATPTATATATATPGGRPTPTPRPRPTPHPRP
jgi:hypothetical protein